MWCFSGRYYILMINQWFIPPNVVSQTEQIVDSILYMHRSFIYFMTGQEQHRFLAYTRVRLWMSETWRKTNQHVVTSLSNIRVLTPFQLQTIKHIDLSLRGKTREKLLSKFSLIQCLRYILQMGIKNAFFSFYRITLVKTRN